MSLSKSEVMNTVGYLEFQEILSPATVHDNTVWFIKEQNVSSINIVWKKNHILLNISEIPLYWY